MDKFRNWILNFMQGRYGFDEYARALNIRIIILLIASIVLGLLGSLLFNVFHQQTAGYVLSLVSNFVNWIALLLLIYSFYRVLSRKHDKRRAENARFLERQAKRRGKKTESKKDISRDNANYRYLTCSFCGQNMRVPRGKGKIAVKCPACGEKTIFNS